MTLQVADGSVTHAEMRRLALLYGLVTFGFELMDWLCVQPGRQRAGLNHTNRHLAVSGW